LQQQLFSLPKVRDLHCAVFISNFSGQIPAQCQTDIEKAAAQLAAATTSVLAAVADCSSGSKPTQCTQDIANTVSDLANAAGYINQAVTDCGGQGSQCAADLIDLVNQLAVATNDITLAVQYCPKNGIKCVQAIYSTVTAVAAATSDISAAITDCSSTDPVFMLYNSDLQADYVSVKQTIFHQKGCGGSGTASEFAIGKCVPDSSGAFIMTCSADGTAFNQTQFSDSACTKQSAVVPGTTGTCYNAGILTYVEFTCV